MVTYEPLTLDMILNDYVNNYHPGEVMDILIGNGYKPLGWLNGGLIPPALNDWEEVYRNRSGSYCIVVSQSTKQLYCIDMGD